jgi:hypothetical protein
VYAAGEYEQDTRTNIAANQAFLASLKIFDIIPETRLIGTKEKLPVDDDGDYQPEEEEDDGEEDDEEEDTLDSGSEPEETRCYKRILRNRSNKGPGCSQSASEQNPAEMQEEDSEEQDDGQEQVYTYTHTAYMHTNTHTHTGGGGSDLI